MNRFVIGNYLLKGITLFEASEESWRNKHGNYRLPTALYTRHKAFNFENAQPMRLCGAIKTLGVKLPQVQAWARNETPNGILPLQNKGRKCLG
jgi:hypothetical protein